MKKIRILLAALLILAMMAPMAMADDEENVPTAVTQTQTIIGKGSYADPTNANVWSILLPTEDVVSFTIDPQKLMYQTVADSDLDYTYYSSATVLFNNYSSDGETLMNVSSELQSLRVENQGTTDVIVSLNIRPTDTNMILAQSSASIPSGSKDPILVFQAKESSGTYEMVPAVGANFSSEILAKSSAWSVTGDTTEGFTFEENTTVTEADGFAWNEAKFSIDAKANDNADAKWTSDLTPPNLELTWYVRNKSIDAIPVVVSSEIRNGHNYVMAADRMYALPSETVTVYVQPSYSDDDSPAGYMVDTDPSDIKTATKNYYTSAYSTVGNTAVTFSNGTSTDNGMMKYVFNVPGESGFEGFSMKASSDSGYVDNQILINGAPTIKKVVITASSQ